MHRAAQRSPWSRRTRRSWARSTPTWRGLVERGHAALRHRRPHRRARSGVRGRRRCTPPSGPIAGRPRRARPRRGAEQRAGRGRRHRDRRRRTRSGSTAASARAPRACGRRATAASPSTSCRAGRVHIALGTVANKQGRVAGINLGGGYATFPGVVGTAVTKVCATEVARTGLDRAGGRGGRLRVRRRDHRVARPRAGYFPGAKPITVKLARRAAAGPAARRPDRRRGGRGQAHRRGRHRPPRRVHRRRSSSTPTSSYAPPFCPLWDPVAVGGRGTCSAAPDSSTLRRRRTVHTAETSRERSGNTVPAICRRPDTDRSELVPCTRSTPATPPGCSSPPPWCCS